MLEGKLFVAKTSIIPRFFSPSNSTFWRVLQFRLFLKNNHSLTILVLSFQPLPAVSSRELHTISVSDPFFVGRMPKLKGVSSSVFFVCVVFTYRNLVAVKRGGRQWMQTLTSRTDCTRVQFKASVFGADNKPSTSTKRGVHRKISPPPRKKKGKTRYWGVLS